MAENESRRNVRRLVAPTGEPLQHSVLGAWGMGRFGMRTSGQTPAMMRSVGELSGRQTAVGIGADAGRHVGVGKQAVVSEFKGPERQEARHAYIVDCTR